MHFVCELCLHALEANKVIDLLPYDWGRTNELLRRQFSLWETHWQAATSNKKTRDCWEDRKKWEFESFRGFTNVWAIVDDSSSHAAHCSERVDIRSCWAVDSSSTEIASWDYRLLALRLFITIAFLHKHNYPSPRHALHTCNFNKCGCIVGNIWSTDRKRERLFSPLWVCGVTWVSNQFPPSIFRDY